MSVADIFLTLLGIGLIVFAFLFAWSMCMIAKVDSEITEALENKAWWEGKESETWKH